MHNRIWSAVTIALSIAVAAMAQATVIDRTSTIERELKPGELHHYSLPMQQGHLARINIVQIGVDVIVDVRDPKGTIIDSVDGPTGRTGVETVEIISRENGLFAIQIRPFNDREPTGKYRLEVKELLGTAE